VDAFLTGRILQTTGLDESLFYPKPILDKTCFAPLGFDPRAKNQFIGLFRSDVLC